MKIIVFAGGTGKRFWPASRKNAPKQFLPIIEDKPLLRIRVDLLRKGFEPEDILISSGAAYEKELKEMFPDLPEENLILEPEMRDTGPAVALAVQYVNHLYPEETVCIQWSDHLIKKPKVFIDSLMQAEELARNEDKTILITVPARFPSPHRGYIKFGELIDGIKGRVELREFVEFVEKPDKKTAEEYIESGDYGWNPGYWVAPAESVLKTIKESRPELYETTKRIVEAGLDSEVAKEFGKLEKIAADYIFAEPLQPDDALALLVEMGWSDIGEWIALKEAMTSGATENYSTGNSMDLDSTDTLVWNFEEGKLVATIGLEGMIVVNTPDVVAVFHKDDNARLKEFLEKLQTEWGDDYL